MPLKGSRTETNLKAAFARESQSYRRYQYFAQRADEEGLAEISALFRATAEADSGHAHGHLEYLAETGDPATGLPLGRTIDNLRTALASETRDGTGIYPGMAQVAREEGFDVIADWLETVARAEEANAERLQKALDSLGP